MKRPRKEKQIAIRLEPQHFRALEEIAEIEDRSIAAVARRLLVKALELQEGKEWKSINSLLKDR